MSRLHALLGPTNTGKTHSAMARLLGHNSGMIGFPLRLLARENYDKAIAQAGVDQVALITGEEKRIPKTARYFICTVEAMPLDRPVEFLGLDEVQLCADPERGHVFTDRLLHARGSEETLFLGAETIAPLLKRLLPSITIQYQPRLSRLTHVAPRKLRRLPRRSAIVAFSAAQVYATAEAMRQSRGGVALVLGALSPRTRNKQVAMYQSGEVDYLVATDAIGMGLNMDIDQVTFAQTRKFDGRKSRALNPCEMGQIAGRAGRHTRDGSFTTADSVAPLTPPVIGMIEQHSYPALTGLYWRNRALDFSTLQSLVQTLDAAPPRAEFIRTAPADDQRALLFLRHDPEISRLARSPAALRLLWEVCQTPDFHKSMTDDHPRLLGQIFTFLVRGRTRIPEDFLERQIARLEQTQGDIDTLIARIASIRTWTFIAHRADWIDQASHWQARTRALDDRLSDALHRRLMERFVDSRATVLVQGLNRGESLDTQIDKSGTVSLAGQPVGQLNGFRFTPEPRATAPGKTPSQPLESATRQAIQDAIKARLAQALADNDGAFRLDETGQVCWREAPFARLKAGARWDRPQIELLAVDFLEASDKIALRRRAESWLAAHLGNRLAPFAALEHNELKGAARGLAFQLLEAGGVLPRAELAETLKSLVGDARKPLLALKIHFGRRYIWLRAVLNPKLWGLRRLLFALTWPAEPSSPPLPPLPEAETLSLSLPKSQIATQDLQSAYYRWLGFADYRSKTGERVLLRLDRAERLEGALWSLCKTKEAQANRGVFALPEDFAAQQGLSEENLAAWIFAFDFRFAAPPKPISPETAAPQETQTEASDAPPSEAHAATPAETIGSQTAPTPIETAEPAETAEPSETAETAEPVDLAAPRQFYRYSRPRDAGREKSAAKASPARPKGHAAAEHSKGAKSSSKLRSNPAKPRQEKAAYTPPKQSKEPALDPDNPFAKLAELRATMR